MPRKRVTPRVEAPAVLNSDGQTDWMIEASSDVSKLTVSGLRQLLKTMNLSTAGRKAELVERLMAALENREKENTHSHKYVRSDHAFSRARTKPLLLQQQLHKSAAPNK
eukprot:SAG31_NODE_8729_length_1398_cov_1.635104_1_plen_108_part_01